MVSKFVEEATTEMCSGTASVVVSVSIVVVGVSVVVMSDGGTSATLVMFNKPVPVFVTSMEATSTVSCPPMKLPPAPPPP